MATHKSAAKRARQAVRRRARNRAIASRVRRSVRTFRRALESSDDDAATKLRATEREIRKATSKGVFKKKWASRQVSRLAKQLHRSRSA